jgi:hypothetical protein
MRNDVVDKTGSVYIRMFIITALSSIPDKWTGVLGHTPRVSHKHCDLCNSGIFQRFL